MPFFWDFLWQFPVNKNTFFWQISLFSFCCRFPLCPIILQCNESNVCSSLNHVCCVSLFCFYGNQHAYIGKRCAICGVFVVYWCPWVKACQVAEWPRMDMSCVCMLCGHDHRLRQERMNEREASMQLCDNYFFPQMQFLLFSPIKI